VNELYKKEEINMAANLSTQNSVITKLRRVKLCQASSDKNRPLAPITHIAFGKGGVDASGNPKTPLDTQNALVSEIARYPVDRVEYPIETTARYIVTIPKDALTGESISEAALVDSNGDLAAIKTMYVKRKDAGVAFTFEFDDEF